MDALVHENFRLLIPFITCRSIDATKGHIKPNYVLYWCFVTENICYRPIYYHHTMYIYNKLNYLNNYLLPFHLYQEKVPAQKAKFARVTTDKADRSVRMQCIVIPCKKAYTHVYLNFLAKLGVLILKQYVVCHICFLQRYFAADPISMQPGWFSLNSSTFGARHQDMVETFR